MKQSTENPGIKTSAENMRRRFLLRYYRAFNLEQCELPQAVLDKLPKIETHEHDPIKAAERIIAGMPNPPEIHYAGSKAFYNPITDRIALPAPELFTSAEERYATEFHEMSHATGSPKRLIAIRSRKPRRSARPLIVLRKSSRKCQPRSYALKRESRQPLSRTRRRTYRAG